MALATDVFEEGWLSCRSWYKLEDKDRRGYKLLPEVRHIGQRDDQAGQAAL